jgi:hypothetical protein
LYSFPDLRLQDPVLFGIIYNLIYTVAKPAGGILFGIAFWTIAKHLPNQAVRRYMLISAFGIMLVFAANQSIFLVLVPYPSFVLVTVSFMGILASYLFYLGIYSASISVSKDSKLRRSIRKAAIKESTKFLDSIGTAEMEHEIEKRVIAMTAATRENMERETGICSSFDEDIRKYLHEALQEIKSKRIRKNDNHT